MAPSDDRSTFGVLGTAEIARKALVPAIAASEHALGAVASRDGERAKRFAEDHGIPRSYGSYETLLEDGGIDATNGWVTVEQAFDAPTDEPVELTYEIDGRRGVETFGPVDQYRLQVERFADRVADGTRPLTGGEEAVANMRVIDALGESADGNESVAVE